MVGEHGPRKDCHIPSSSHVTHSALFWTALIHLSCGVGDLFYLEVRTLEGTFYYITACTRGFFVNNTKQGGNFDPTPAYLSSSSS